LTAAEGAGIVKSAVLKPAQSKRVGTGLGDLLEERRGPTGTARYQQIEEFGCERS